MNKYRDNTLPIAYDGDDSYVFISYSRKDKEIVYADLLEMNKLGVRFWYDDNIEAGENWRETVKKKITSEKCVGIIFYLSKNTLFSEPIEAEIKFAFGANIEQRKNNFALLIDYDNYNYSLDKIIENEIKNINDITLIQRSNLVSNIFGGDINYLFRSPIPSEFTTHFYKMILRISKFGALPIDVINKLIPDYSDFEFKHLDDGLSFTSYNGKEEIIYIPSKAFGKDIIKIDDNAFKGNIYVKSIHIPNTITEIGSRVFYGCENLNEVVFDIKKSNLHTIGYKAFYDCFNLKELHLPCSLKIIDCQAFGECEFSKQTVDNLYFYSEIPPKFDMECADGSKLFVPVIARLDYIKASGLSKNVYSVLDEPKNLYYKENKIYWDKVTAASSYEIDEDGIPIAIVKENEYEYSNINGLHSITIRALGTFKDNIISSNFSEELTCGVTSLDELYLNKNQDTVLIYKGVNKIVVLPSIIKKIIGSCLIFYNTVELHVPSTVSEIEYKTVAGIKKLIIDKENPFFHTTDGKIYHTETMTYLRDEVLGDTYFVDGIEYDVETHCGVSKKK